nr:hypothetical protein [Tanacetum cinerariifolium]
MIIISRSTRSFTPLSITRHHRNHHGHLNRLTPSPRCHPPPSPPAASITPPLVPTYTTAGTTTTAAASSRCRRRTVRGQTTIVVAVGRQYSHHSRTLWCRAVMVQPLVKHRGGQPPKTTSVVATEPTTATTAAPSWCWACG